MISADEYASYDALGLAELVARKQVTPAELVEAALDAIARINPTLNAVLQVLPGEADAAITAGLPQGPFTGVPFLIKEIELQAKGVRNDMGSALAQGFVADHDSELMARFRRAGFVLAGTTNLPEFGCCPSTESRLHGPTHNPWDLGRTAGGSSGGSAAAVAARIVPIAHGNDGAGSIRVPAACTGVIGLKPTRDRVPTGPDSGDSCCGLSIDFALTRSVRDTAALLDAVAGADAGAPGQPVPPPRPYAELARERPARLRIGWSTTPASGARIDPACERAVHETIRLLEALGHHVVESAPRYDWDEFIDHAAVIWACIGASGVDAVAAMMGRVPGPTTLEAATLAYWEEGRRHPATRLLAALDYGNRLSRSVGAFFETIDVALSPTLAREPIRLGELNQDRPGVTAREWTEAAFTFTAFTPLYNTTGQPAISLPLHWSDAGLPIGVQFAGRFGDEATLLRLAAELEAARPWAGRRPPISA